MLYRDLTFIVNSLEIFLNFYFDTINAPCYTSIYKGEFMSNRKILKETLNTVNNRYHEVKLHMLKNNAPVDEIRKLEKSHLNLVNKIREENSDDLDKLNNGKFITIKM